MESRLPKPKSVGLKKVISASEVSLASLTAPSSANVISQASLTAVRSMEVIGKSKTTLSTNASASNENKPPTKPLLTRSHTSVAIARNVSKVAVKRLGTTSTAVETKRANIRPTVKPAANQGGARVGITNTTTGKSAGGNASGVAKTVPKPSKWDLKGRLQLATSELLNLKEQHKKCPQLQSTINELKEKETLMILKNEQLEKANAELTDKCQTAEKNFTDILDKYEIIKTELKQSQDSHEQVSKALKKCEEICESQNKTLSEHASKVKNLEIDLDEHKQNNVKLTEKVENLQSLIHQMDKDRRLLHNTIQELKGNIRVFCRVRPRIPKESAKNLCTINFIDESTIEVGRYDATDSISCSSKSRGLKQEFAFDKIFPPMTSQAEVFEELSLLVQSALEGYNVCVFAYGQTGSGKTYTMEGTRSFEGEGMVPRTVRHIFQEMKQFELLGWQYRIEASFLEIYNEHIVDLLDSKQKNHEIRMADSKGNDLYVSNLRVEEIHSPEELNICLQTAQQNRAVAATYSNERSSRSHSVARIRLIGTHEKKDEICVGNLNLVDLAGSEKLRSEEAARTTETKNINKSLANLGNVILALLKKQDHIPYRNSKLTHLLMPSLGGNSKTLMLLNVSPLDECYNETLNSLRFASNVNSCKTGNVKRSRQLIQHSM